MSAGSFWLGNNVMKGKWCNEKKVYIEEDRWKSMVELWNVSSVGLFSKLDNG